VTFIIGNGSIINVAVKSGSTIRLDILLTAQMLIAKWRTFVSVQEMKACVVVVVGGGGCGIVDPLILYLASKRR